MVVNILEEPSAVYGYANEPVSNNGIVLAGGTARLVSEQLLLTSAQQDSILKEAGQKTSRWFGKRQSSASVLESQAHSVTA